MQDNCQNSSKGFLTSTGFEYRDRVRQQFCSVFRQYSGSGVDRAWQFECAVQLETALYKVHKHGKPYTDKCRSLLYNLQDSKNPKPL